MSFVLRDTVAHLSNSVVESKGRQVIPSVIRPTASLRASSWNLVALYSSSSVSQIRRDIISEKVYFVH